MLLVVKKPLTIRKVGGENGKSNDVWPPSANHCLFWKDVAFPVTAVTFICTKATKMDSQWLLLPSVGLVCLNFNPT